MRRLRRRPRISLQRKVILGMASTLLLLIMAVVAAGFLANERESRAQNRQSVDVLLALARLEAAVAEAEAAQRMFLLSGDVPEVHASGALTTTGAGVAVLRTLSAGDERRADLLEDVSLAIDAQLAELEALIELQRTQGREVALRAFLDDDRPAKEAARGALLRLEAREIELRAARRAELERARALLFLVIFIGCGLSALLNVIVQFSIRSDLRQRERDEELLAAQALRLDESEEALARQLELLAEANTALATRSFELEEANARAEQLVFDISQSNRDLAQFAYVASHDLKAPLRGIASLATWIEEDSDTLNERSREHLRMLRQRITRMEAMIEGVLQYSHAGRDADDVVDTTLSAFIRETVELAAPPPNVQVVVSGGDFDVEIAAIPLQQVVLNLVGNAIKHGTPHGGVVRVIAESAGNERTPDDVYFEGTPPAGLSAASAWFRVRVRDEGPGIDPRYHERIFGLFQTLQPKDRVEGAGIGLAVVKKLVELQGGVVQVDSAEGRGTEISFTWPKHPKKRARAKANAA